jgi:cell division inhibitor SepF
MAGLWQKTLFYLGLVDEESPAPVEPAQPQPEGGVRTVDPPGSRARRRGTATADAGDAATGSTAEPIDPTRPRTTVAGRRVEPPSAQRRRVSSNPEHAEAGVLVRTGESISVRSGETGMVETEIIEARTFTDAQVLADHIREGTSVVLDLRSTEPAMVRRLVDFATGLTYALDGRMAKIAQGVILVSPPGRVIGIEEQERLRELGLYKLD